MRSLLRKSGLFNWPNAHDATAADSDNEKRTGGGKNKSLRSAGGGLMETDGFLEPHTARGSTEPIVKNRPSLLSCWPLAGCCLAVFFFVMGMSALLCGEDLLGGLVMNAMKLVPGTPYTTNWMDPPVETYFSVYQFHLANVDEVLAGGKPKLVERGPYVFRSKGQNDYVEWNEDESEVTYRARTIYTYMPSLSGEGLDPDSDVFTVPNVPLWTGLNSMGEGLRDAKRWFLFSQTESEPKPFINVTINGLLWGYETPLPCLKLDLPGRCRDGAEEDSSEFGATSVSWESWEHESDDWGQSWSATRLQTEDDAKETEDPTSPFYGLAKPLAGYDEDCQCQWGLLRDRNVTLRRPLTLMTGEGNARGSIVAFDGSPTLGQWREGSKCDLIQGRQDGMTFPLKTTRHHELDLFVPILQRAMPLVYEKEVDYSGVRTLRFIPPRNVLGAHDDPDSSMRNSDNDCYCLAEHKYKCFKSGLLNLGPSQRRQDEELRPPVALSLPHFYNADPSYVEAVEGMRPSKATHEFFLDIVPRFGVPLAAQPRYQLNVIVGSGVDPEWPVIGSMKKEIVLPLLWGQEGFPSPSDEMVRLTRLGLNGPHVAALVGAGLCFAVAVTLLVCTIVHTARKQSKWADLERTEEESEEGSARLS